MRLQIRIRRHSHPPKLFQHVLRQELEQHLGREVRLPLLVASVPDIGQVEPDLADVLQSDILRRKEAGEAVIVAAAEVKGDVAVKWLDG